MVRRSIRTSLCNKNSTVSQSVHQHCRTQLNDVGGHCVNTSNIVQKVSYRKGIVDVIRPGQRKNSQATTTITKRISKKKYKQKLRRQRHITNHPCSNESPLQQVKVEPRRNDSSESISVEAISPLSAKVAIPSTNTDDEPQEFNESNKTSSFEDVQLDTEDSGHDDLSYDRIDIREVQGVSSNVHNHSDCIIC